MGLFKKIDDKFDDIHDWATDKAKKAGKAIKNTASDIGDWAIEKYNNAKTAIMLSDNSPAPTPSPTYASSGNSTRTGEPYTPYVGKSKSNSNNNSSSNKSSSSNSNSITKNRNAEAAKYEVEKAKTTAIENIQKSLNTIKQADFNDEELKIDGDFGPKTQFAWNKLIESKGLENYLANISNIGRGTPYVYSNVSYPGYIPNAQNSIYKQMQTIRQDNSLTDIEKVDRMLALTSTGYGATKNTFKNINNVAGIKKYTANGHTSDKYNDDEVANLQKKTDKLLSEKRYSDIEVVKNKSGGYTLKETADFKDAYKNHDFNSDVRGFKGNQLDDYIESKGFSKLDGTKAIREIDISPASYKILNSVDKVSDVVKKGSKAIGVVGDVLSYTSAGVQVVSDFADGGEFKEETFEAVGSAVVDSLGGAVGAKAGAVIGATIGSVIPVVGTIAGGVIGGIIGGVAGSMLGNKIGDWAGSKVHDMVY